MATLVHNQNMVKKYNVDELSTFQKWTIDYEEKEMIIRLTKIFLALNGASGCNVRNIPPNMAGFFSYYADIKIYQRLKILKGRIDSYQRHVDITPMMFNKIKEELNSIKQHWDYVVVSKRGTIPANISFDTAIEDLQNLDNVTINNFNNYTGYSWIQWYEYLETQFNQLIEKCKAKGKAYTQSYLLWFVSFFNPVSWYNFVRHGGTRFSKTVEEYKNFNNVSVLPKRNIVFNRLDDVNTANQALNDLVELIALEEIAISDPQNCRITQQVIQNTMAFKSECDRLLIIIRDRIGFIGHNHSVIE